uniref:Small ribosomal subunit protein uS3c n=1 Tax=Mitrastemon kanehirai TaxID=1358725 RepID=A0A4Y1MCH0_9ERIC|nr:ribosomal protein S3 [Mitrastemon kanehirai]
MGQKINPLIYRLGITINYDSFWFSKKKNYFQNFQEDQKIRNFINFFFSKQQIYKISYDINLIEGITRIKIKKKINFIKIILFIGFTKLLKKNSPQELKKRLILLLTFEKKKLIFIIKKIKKPYRNPKIIAEFISNQLKNKVSCNKAMKKSIELAEKSDIKGIQIQISGRIGKNNSRMEWIRKGQVPLQMIQANINYCSYSIRTISGILGIKIWIFLKDKDYEK